jgi:hypothetical protein
MNTHPHYDITAISLLAPGMSPYPHVLAGRQWRMRNRAQGHGQFRRPHLVAPLVVGYGNEADPCVMAIQINAAVDHGVNVLI